MEMIESTLLWFCALGCGLIGGLYFAFSAFIMRALGDIDSVAGIAAMNSINQAILRSLFMPLFFGTTLACATLVVIGFMQSGSSHGPLLIAGGLLYVIGMFVVTMACNVPLNGALLRGGMRDAATWRRYLSNWTRWNHVRTIASLVASALFIASLARS
jgi:uncharacterized membrane protein